MEVKVFADAEAASQAVVPYFRAVAEKNGTFGLATGSTPERLYELLVESDIDFSQSYSINLDEYVGLPADHVQSYNYFMHQHLFNQKPFKHSYLMDGANDDAEAVTAAHEQALKEHPVDLQLLGIGNNGHIGFNEPGSAFDSRTRVVNLTDSTVEANKRFFASADDVPRQAYSMGIGSILDAKQIILMAFGEKKADAIQKTVEGPVTEDVPASALQNHPNALIIVDQAAASRLTNA